MKRRAAVLSSLLLAALLPPAARPADDAPKDIVLREGLVVEPVGRYGRSPIHTDALEARLVAGKWAAPKAGDAVTVPGGPAREWQEAKADKDGWLTHNALRGGYAYFAVPSDADRVMVLEASGHAFAYFNGEPHTGDPYGYGYVRVPVALKKGTNDLLLLSPRGRVRAKLVAPKAAAQLDTGDTTLPDPLADVRMVADAALPVLNTTTERLDGLTLEAKVGDWRASRTALPPLPPLSQRKVGFTLEALAAQPAGECEVTLTLLKKGQDKPLDTATVKLRVRKPDQSRKVTFVSAIDGSVQYFAVQPARAPAEGDRRPPALVLTLHGAAVEAIGQADAYGGKSWAHVVAPTNRRPYGFDWEDWGRLDALEVLDLAPKLLKTDPRRVYLTGHSMGGHGTWQVGATVPDRFAAIAPSAGWVSFWSYAGAIKPDKTTPLQELLLRSMNPSDTLALARNYAQYGVYVLHGDADDNVPVSEARAMRRALGEFHPDFSYYERPGAGHWWGNECVDWPPLFDFLQRHTLPQPAEVRKVEFVTASPGVSARSQWVTVEAQQHALKFSAVKITCDPDKRRFAGTTDNVARLALDLAAPSAPTGRGTGRGGPPRDGVTRSGPLKPGEPLAVELDGTKIEKIAWPEKGRLWLARDGDKWSVIDEPSAALKGPHRYGPFKDAFRNRMVFVYGTKGTKEENAQALARARYDAETFWYRGNGSVDVVPDSDFDPKKGRDRNVILYGNADSNGAWTALLGDGPVQVRRGSVKVGDHEVKGEDLACVFVRPRPGSDRACVAAVSGTGLVGMRLTERLPYFVSGVGYPDCLVVGAESLTKGMDGVRGAGFFGNDWGVASGEFVWKE